MKKRIAKLFVLAGFFVVFALLLGVPAQAAENPLSFFIEVTPKALTGSASVRVSINIINMGEDTTPISVTLFDPDGNLCSTFGSGGTANLAAGQSAAYSGNWTVTQAQLDAGRISYTARYTVTNETGNKVPASQPINATITYSQAKALLNIERVLEPGMAVQKDQTVAVRYTIKNVGTVDVTNITISDPDIIATPVVHPALAVGDTAELSYSYVATSGSKTTHAEITYQYDVSGKVETSKIMKADPPLTITVTVPDLSVELSSTTQIVNPGDKVDLSYQITNNSTLGYEKLKITDKILGDIDANISLAGGKSHQDTKSITVNTSGTYQFTVTGVDSSGADVFFLSNELTIQTTDMIDESLLNPAVPTNLEVVIEADRDVVYSEPAEVVFHIQVTNTGDTPMDDVVVAAIKQPIKTIESIAPGETVDVYKALNISMSGQYQFTASSADNVGTENVAASNIYRITYTAPAPTATPTPEPTPEPTEPPPVITLEATEDPNTPFSVDGGRSGSGLGSILLYVLGGLLGVIILAVGVLFFVDQRRSRARQYTPGGGPGGPNGGGAPAPGGASGRQQPTKVIDTIQRVPHRDYTRPAKPGTQREIGVPSNDAGVPPSSAGAKPAFIPAGGVKVFEEPDSFVEPRPTGKLSAVTQVPVSDNPSLFTTDSSLDEDVFSVARSYKRQEEDAPEEEDAFLPETPEKPEKAEPSASPYARPTPSVAELFDSGMSDADADTAPEADIGDTEVYKSDYLSKLRGASKGVDPLADTTPSTRLSQKQSSSLLSGSTAQYRLSRRTAPADRDKSARTPRTVEDPEAFARKQRASRARTEDSNFYDDDDDPRPAKRKR